jgi:hypothetical protein
VRKITGTFCIESARLFSSIVEIDEKTIEFLVVGIIV